MTSYESSYTPTPVPNLYTTMSSYVYDSSNNYIYISTNLGMTCNELYSRIRLSNWTYYSAQQLEHCELSKDGNTIPRSDSLLCHLSNISSTSELSYCRFDASFPSSDTTPAETHDETSIYDSDSD